MSRIFVSLVVILTLAACSRPVMPMGRWEGTFESNDVMIAARVETTPNGMVRVSAPDLVGISGASEDDRKGMREQLTSGLAEGWDSVSPRPFDFDGHEFRKPGGIAPQMIWDPGQKTMTLVVYLGTRPAIHIPLRPVGDFSDNPWASA